MFVIVLFLCSEFRVVLSHSVAMHRTENCIWRSSQKLYSLFVCTYRDLKSMRCSGDSHHWYVAFILSLDMCVCLHDFTAAAAAAFCFLLFDSQPQGSRQLSIEDFLAKTAEEATSRSGWPEFLKPPTVRGAGDIFAWKTEPKQTEVRACSLSFFRFPLIVMV